MWRRRWLKWYSLHKTHFSWIERQFFMQRRHFGDQDWIFSASISPSKNVKFWVTNFTNVIQKNTRLLALIRFKRYTIMILLVVWSNKMIKASLSVVPLTSEIYAIWISDKLWNNGNKGHGDFFQSESSTHFKQKKSNDDLFWMKKSFFKTPWPPKCDIFQSKKDVLQRELLVSFGSLNI